ncbi:MAG: hypothetical protein ABEJ82_01000 [Haloplanus sp.]
MDDGQILGTTKVTDRWRISLIKAVREELSERQSAVDVGDRIVFKERDGEIILEVA